MINWQEVSEALKELRMAIEKDRRTGGGKTATREALSEASLLSFEIEQSLDFNSLPKPLEEEINLFKRGEKIQAIKALRDRTKCGLREAYHSLMNASV